jgi:hypothetical protein
MSYSLKFHPILSRFVSTNMVTKPSILSDDPIRRSLQKVSLFLSGLESCPKMSEVQKTAWKYRTGRDKKCLTEKLDGLTGEKTLGMITCNPI